MLYYILIGTVIVLYAAIELSILIKNPNTRVETFTTLQPEDLPVKNLLISDIYPAKITADTILKYNNLIWTKNQPINVNGYEQVTNNIEYPISPDNGSCIPSVFCYTFYANNNIAPDTHITNMVLSENSKDTPTTKDPKNKVRVGYFSTTTAPFF